MNDARLRWSVFPWTRYDDDDQVPGVPGAAVTDSRRQITYRATVNAQGYLDHLEIEMTGHIDDARLARLRSIPRERIEATVAAFVRDQEPGTLQFVPEGGLIAEGGAPGTTPTSQEVADLMRKHGWGRQELAVYYRRPVRTVDGWIARARAELGDVAPRPATGRGFRSIENPGARGAPGQPKNEEKEK